MKNFIFISVILFGASLLINGCYTYLSLSNGAALAEVPYEPYFPPDDPCPPPPPPAPPPKPRPDPIIRPYIPPPPHYERPNDVIDIRNGGEGRNTDTEISRRR